MTPPVVPGYAVGSLIARGTFATVWSARPVDGDADVAVKVVPVASSRTDPYADGQNAEALAFELSALAGTRGRADHIVEVYDVVPISDPAPAVAIVMERLRHGTLARLVSTRGHLLAGEVVTVVTPMAHTVGLLHEGAVVHGDLSPSNIGFDSVGRPVLLDLGVSSVIGTPREHVYGTPGFVAPEIAAGGPPAAASDVYALGALGWYALTGEPPEIPSERPALLEAVSSVPSALAEAIERALDPEPVERGSALELATAVYEATRAAPISMVHGDDPALFLTHRVRQLARESAGTPAEPHRRGLWGQASRWRDRKGVRDREAGESIDTPRTGRNLSRDHRDARGPVRRPDPGNAPGAGEPAGSLTRSQRRTAMRDQERLRQRSRGAHLRVLSTLVLAVLLGVAGVAVATAERGPAHDQEQTSRSAAADPPPHRESSPPQEEGVEAENTGEEATGLDGTQTEPPRRGEASPAHAVLQELLEARARAWSSGSTAVLDEVFAPGAPMRAADLAALEKAAGFRYEGLSFTASETRVHSEAGDRIVMAATVTTSGYEVRSRTDGMGGESALEQRPASASRLRVTLARVDGGWRILEVEELST